MLEKKIVVRCRVPKMLLFDDVLPYVRRKLGGIGSFFPATLTMVRLPFSSSRTIDYEFVAQAREKDIPSLLRHDIVLGVEDYAEPTPSGSPAENVEPLFADEPPAGVATGGFGPFKEPYETIWRLTKPLRYAVVLGVFLPIATALDHYEKARSRYYRDWA